ncbi:MAG TPA: YitT family protein [Bacteroidales bacterium]|nr:YitT family protein [Bacteroidales bacterium]
MKILNKEKLFSAKWFKSLALILSGTFIMSLGYVYFISPYKITPGGVYGIAIVIHHLFDLPIGLTALAFEIPITLLGLKLLGPRFGWKTIVGFVSMAGFVDLLTYFNGDTPLVESDTLLSAIFGGVLIGVGLGLVFKSRASSGGSDVIAMILNKYTRIPLGTLIIYVDSVIVLISLVAFKDWTIPLYSWLVIYITGKTVGVILEGVSYEKAIFIISDKYEEIKETIIQDLDRGGTIFHGKGMYSQEEKQIIYTTVSRREFELLKDYIYEIDPKAFITVTEAHEIIGEGFKSIKDSLSSQS